MNSHYGQRARYWFILIDSVILIADILRSADYRANTEVPIFEGRKNN